MRFMGRMGFGRGDVRARSTRARRSACPVLPPSPCPRRWRARCSSAPPSRPRRGGRRARRHRPLPGHPGRRRHGRVPRSAADRGSTARCCSSQQDDVLDEIGVRAQPLYRWTTALNGFAAELTPARRRRSAATSRGSRSSSRTPSARSPAAPGAGAGLGRARPAARRRRRGHRRGRHRASGRRARSSPPSPGSVARPRDFHGELRRPATAGHRDDCNGKVVGARWFVAGFGGRPCAARRRSRRATTAATAPRWRRSPPATPACPVRVPGQRLGPYGGVAPQARIAVYKACWSAPDPADDGCATADLVTAIDRATADGVDVLNLSVGGPAAVDTVERALLGAAEKDVVVVAAAGNRGRTMYAAHPSPWVTTVGGTTGDLRLGRSISPAEPSSLGRCRPPGPSARPGWSCGARRAGARRLAGSRPGSAAPAALDASRTAGAIVLCERGGIGRVDKSQAVDQADGVGMVLANVAPGGVESDLHSVPTVHLRPDAARRLETVGGPPPATAGSPWRRRAPEPGPQVTHLVQQRRPDRDRGQARRRGTGRRHPGRRAAVRARHPLGLRHRYVGRHRLDQRAGPATARRPPPLVRRRRPLRPGHAARTP